jgi:mannose-6-phosphate isomerase-like protein (cupin superfamily)
VQVLQSVEVSPRSDDPATAPRSDDPATVRATLGAHTGFSALEQAVLECPSGCRMRRRTGSCEETLFVLQGQGLLIIDGEEHSLEPELGAYLAPGVQYELQSSGSEALRLVSVRIPDPEPAGADTAPRCVVRRLAEQRSQEATTDREFRIVADPSCGLRSATHFVGYIPTARAPEHFHTYDEVIYVLEGEGVMRSGEVEALVQPGTCIQLPARTVHSLENRGERPMHVVAVFRPAGSPAEAYYPDGTPAFDPGRVSEAA